MEYDGVAPKGLRFHEAARTIRDVIVIKDTAFGTAQIRNHKS